MFFSRSAVAALAVASLAAPTAAHASYGDAVLADDPLTYLKLDESSGTTALDAARDPHHGTYTGAFALGAIAPFTGAGTAASFAPGGAVAAAAPAGARSVELWVRPARRGSQALVAQGGKSGWALGINAKRKLVFRNAGQDVNSRISLPAGTWSMLTASWDGGSVQFTVNGGAVVKSWKLPSGVAASGELQVGGTGFEQFAAYQGRVDEVALYPQPLTPADAKERFNQSALPFGVAAPGIDAPAEPQAGDQLTVRPGIWEKATIAPTYRWMRCDASGEACAPIAGATGATYTVTPADAGSTLVVEETVGSAAGYTTAVSDPTGKVKGEAPVGGGTGEDPDPIEVGVDPVPVDPGTGTGTGTGTDTGTGTGTGAGTSAPTATTSPSGTIEVAGTTTTSPAAGTRCLRLVRPVKARKAGKGVLRLRAGRGGCVSRKAPLVLTVRGKGVKKVAYKLDGRKVRAARKGAFTAKLVASRLKAGRHVLVVRVTPKRGAAKTVKLRFRTTGR